MSHNSVILDFAIPTNHYIYNYMMFQTYCCTRPTASNELILINNNNVFARLTGSIHYDYMVYFRYYTESKGNNIFNAGGNWNYIGYNAPNGTGAYYFNIAAFNGNLPADQRTNVSGNPNLVNIANRNFAFTNPLLNAAAAPSNVIRDYNNTPRNLSAPDIGAIEVPFDYSVTGTFQGGSSVCASYSENLKFRINNLMPFPLPMGRLGFRLNNLPVQIQERGPVPANGSLEVTFDNPVQFFGQPANSVLKVFIAHADDNNVNDTLTYNITVTPSPSGSSLTAVPTQAQLSDFATINPDVTIPGEAVEFRVSPPTGFTNTGYGTTWTATANAFRVSDNAPVTGLTWTAPAGGNNGTWSYDPAFVNTNQIIEIQLRVNDLGNGCDSTLCSTNRNLSIQTSSTNLRRRRSRI
jgi:hypothetical protein